MLSAQKKVFFPGKQTDQIQEARLRPPTGTSKTPRSPSFDMGSCSEALHRMIIYLDQKVSNTIAFWALGDFAPSCLTFSEDRWKGDVGFQS